jgi:hypothetical protein
MSVLLSMLRSQDGESTPSTYTSTYYATLSSVVQSYSHFVHTKVFNDKHAII